MTEALLPEAGLRALEVGTGSGYQAALLAALGLEVWTVERIAGLLARAEPLWERLGVAGRIHARHADGYRGWPEAAPFARVIITAAPRELPRALFGQLGDGGLLVTPLGGEADQRLLRFRLRGERAFREDLGACSFVPMLGRTVGTA